MACWSDVEFGKINVDICNKCKLCESLLNKDSHNFATMCAVTAHSAVCLSLCVLVLGT